jgi:chemotaxis methyl-accepting protein methylase
MLLARELTGTKVNQVNHSVIVQNVSLRLQATGCETLEEYLAYADGNDQEMAQLLSAVTIHTTSWFGPRKNAARFTSKLSSANPK